MAKADSNVECKGICPMCHVYGDWKLVKHSPDFTYDIFLCLACNTHFSTEDLTTIDPVLPYQGRCRPKD